HSAILRDVSERKRAEATIRRLHDGLELRVRERTAELEAVNRELSRQTRENETFVYSVSHDLRSPLVNLQGFSRELTLSAGELRELLGRPGVPDEVRQRALAVLDGDVAESTRFILSAVSRLAAIIDALLRLSRAGRLEYRLQPIDVNQI